MDKNTITNVKYWATYGSDTVIPVSKPAVPKELLSGPDELIVKGFYPGDRQISWERLASLFPARLPYPHLFPKHTILAQEALDGSHVFLIEIPPRIVEFKVTTDGYLRDRIIPLGKFNIAVPWQYFIITVGMDFYGRNPIVLYKRLFWARNKIEGLDTLVIEAALPNVQTGSGSVCLGHEAVNRFGNNPTQNIDEFVDHFWDSSFNGHLGWRIPLRYRDAKNPYEEWATDSANNPFCYLDWAEWAEGKPLLKPHFLNTAEVPTKEAFFALLYQRIISKGG